MQAVFEINGDKCVPLFVGEDKRFCGLIVNGVVAETTPEFWKAMNDLFEVNAARSDQVESFVGSIMKD